MNSSAWNETVSRRRPTPTPSGREEASRRIPAPLTGADAPHPLRKLAERLGRSQGRQQQPLPDIFEQFLRDQMTRPGASPEHRSPVLPSRNLDRRPRRRARRADI